MKGISEATEARWAVGDLRALAEQAEGASYSDPAKIIKLRAAADEALEEWRAKYPREAALEVAAGWSSSRDYRKAACGRKAEQRIEAGEPYAEVLAEMEAEWGQVLRGVAAGC